MQTVPNQAVLAEAVNRVDVRVADLESALHRDECFPIIHADPSYSSAITSHGGPATRLPSTKAQTDSI